MAGDSWWRLMIAENRAGSELANSFCFDDLACVLHSMIHIFPRHRPIDTLLAACATIVVAEDSALLISRMRDLDSRAAAAADAAAAAARKSLDVPILLSFVITTVMAYLFQSIIMRSSGLTAAAAAVVYSAAPAALIYPHRCAGFRAAELLRYHSLRIAVTRAFGTFFILFFSIIIIFTAATVCFSLPLPFNLLFSFKVWAIVFVVSSSI